MTNTSFKSFKLEQINKVLIEINQMFFIETFKGLYVEVDKLRYVRVTTLFTSLISFRRHRRADIVTLLSLSGRRILKILWYLATWNTYSFPSNADVIHIRNNMSTFYFQNRVRVKAYVSGGIRTREDLVNEYKIRQELEQSKSNVKVPQVLDFVHNEKSICYIDEIIIGKGIGWSAPGSTEIAGRLVDIIFSFYREKGLRLLSLNDIAPRVVDELQISLNNDGIHNTLLLKIAKKKMIFSMLHGDLSLGNVILKGSELYVIDWELAAFGPVIYDLFQIITRKPVLWKKIEQHTEDYLSSLEEIDKYEVASLEEQFEIVSFMKEYSIKWVENADTYEI